MDEGRPDTGVSVATQEAVGVAVAHRTRPILCKLVVVAGVKAGGVMQDVRHSVKQRRNQNTRFLNHSVKRMVGPC